MDAYLLANEFIAWLGSLHTAPPPDGDGSILLEDWTLVNGQCSDDAAYPRAVFDATAESLVGSSRVGTGRLTISIESHAQDSSAGEHAALVETMRRLLFGDTGPEKAAIAANVASINARGNIEILGYSAAQTDPGIEQNAFKTPLTLVCGFRVI